MVPPSPSNCRERDKLLREYIAAVARIIEAGKVNDGGQSVEWEQATADARANCRKAITALNRHREWHGC